MTDTIPQPDQAAMDAALQQAGASSTFSDSDWASQIQEAQKYIKPSEEKLAVKDVGPKAIAKTIDHTLLKLDATAEQIDVLCKEAKDDDFKSVCVRLPWVPRSLQNLTSTSVLIACVIGFHEGTHSTSSKLSESSSAVRAGATELDVVLNWPSLKQKQYTNIYTELAAIRALCPNTTLKLIFETSRLEEEEILAACHLAAAAKWEFVKTSTGFDGRGASIRDVQLMRAAALWYAAEEGRALLRKAGERVGGGPLMKVKASGGVRTFVDAVKMLEVGAERIGASSGVRIVQEAKAGGKVEGGEGAGDGY